MTNRKLTQGTAIPTLAAADKFYIVPNTGTVPWGYMSGSVLAGYSAFGGTVYPHGAAANGEYLKLSGGTIVSAGAFLNPSNWTGSFYAQDAAPSSPVADDIWLETDTNLLWTYGTYAAASRWVSISSFMMVNTLSNVTASTTQFPGQTGFGYDVYLEKFYLKYHIATTNDGTNYWTITPRKVSGLTLPAAGAGSLLATGLTTQSLSPNAWGELNSTADAVVDFTGVSIELVFYDIVKTLSPGAIYASFALTARLVHP